MSNNPRSEQQSDKTQVQEVMNPEVPVASPTISATDAQQILERENSHYLLIVDRDEVIGIVCASDLAGADSDATVSSCMRAPVLGICERATVDEAARLMDDTGLGCLPVFWHDGSLLGLVTREEVRAESC